MNIDEQIKVMQAYRDGAEIEASSKHRDHWLAATRLSWDWPHTNYRIKKQPKTVTLHYYRATKAHPSDASMGRLVEIYDHPLTFPLGNPYGMKLIKTETIEVNE